MLVIIALAFVVALVWTAARRPNAGPPNVGRHPDAVRRDRPHRRGLR